MYKNLFLQYKNKYKQLKNQIGSSLSFNIRIATNGDKCIRDFYLPDEDKYNCIMCSRNISIDDIVILKCNCCFHYSCLLKQCYNNARTRSKLNMDGIRCPNRHPDLDNLQNTITGNDINIIIELFEEKLLEQKKNKGELRYTAKHYGRFYDDYRNISEFLNKNLERNLAEKKLRELGELGELGKELEESEEKVDDMLSQKYMELTSKECPSCYMKTVRYHGHACHHIKPASFLGDATAGCSVCHKHYCFSCLSTEDMNLEERGDRTLCRCTWRLEMIRDRHPYIVEQARRDNYIMGVGYVDETYFDLENDYTGALPTTQNWSTFCCQSINEDEIIVEDCIARDKRCGCIFCPDCRRNKPCKDCQGDCIVCKGIVRPNPKELSDVVILPNYFILGPPPQIHLLSIEAERKNVTYKYILHHLRDNYDIDIEDEVFLDGVLENILEIKIVQGRIGIVPNNLFSKFINLRELSLLDCDITNFEKDVFKNLRLLNELNISRCKIQDIPLGIKNLSSLNTLFISNTNIKQITNLPSNLIELHLSNNHLLEDLKGLNNLRFLQRLSLIQSNISSTLTESQIKKKKQNPGLLIDSTLAQLSAIIPSLYNLEELKLEDNKKITHLFENTFMNNNLTLIGLNGCLIKRIDSNSFVNLPFLHQVDMKSNDMDNTTQISRLLFNFCPKLKKISLRNNPKLTKHINITKQETGQPQRTHGCFQINK